MGRWKSPGDGVLVLTSTFPRHEGDPTGRFLADLLGALPFQFTVVCPDDPETGPLELANVRRVRFRNQGVFFGAGATENWRSGRSGLIALATSMLSMLSASLRGCLGCRVIWSHWAVPAGLVGALCHRLLCRRHVLLLHSGDVWFLENLWAGRRIARFIARNSDRVFAVNGSLAERFGRLSGVHPEVLGMGVARNGAADSRIASRAFGDERHPGRGIVGTLSRLVASKGVEALLARSERLDGLLHVAGDGPDRPAVVRACEAIPNARFRGPLLGEHKERFLAEIDVFAAPYGRGPRGQTEGTPVAVLEAMAAGRAVVAFEGSVPAELIEDGVTGVVVNDGDYEAFIEAANRLLSNPSLRARLGRAARTRVEPFLMERVAKTWAEVLAA